MIANYSIRFILLGKYFDVTILYTSFILISLVQLQMLLCIKKLKIFSHI